MATINSTYLIGFSSGGTSANKEDVLEMVINIDPYDTPFATTAPKTTCAHTTHEWITDTLAGTATAAGVEGGDFVAAEQSGRTRVTNITQIFRKDLKVSNTQRAVQPFGVRDEYAYQIMKATRELARNIEVVVLGAAGASVTGSSASARHMKRLQDFLTTNDPWSRGTVLQNSAADATGLAHPIFEGDFNAMLEVIYNQGGNPDAVYVSPAVKRQISKYGGAVATTTSANYLELRRDISAAERRLVRAINVYESDFGSIQIVLDRWVPQNTAATNTSTDLTGRMFFLERSRCRLAFLRPMRHIPLAPNGDSTRGIVLGELTLEVLAENGSGMIKNVNSRDA